MAKMIVSIDGVVIKEVQLTKERTTLGRRPYNDIVIDNLAVSGEHAVFHQQGDEVEAEDLGSTNGTYVNGKLIKKHALQNGDVITVGRHQLRFVDTATDSEENDEFAQTMVLSKSDVTSSGVHVAPVVVRNGSDRSAPAAVQAKIQVLNGSFAGRELSLNKALTTMGQPGVQVIAITRRGDGYHLVQVENAPNREAPKVNGQPVGAKAHKLADNDVIELVGIKMGFFLD